ncbi:MAG: GlsB/YeaQ/YmgE family stress response membrane protein [Thermoleophilaceae bacterium]|nr:GlsB/YeaQ/YmgE family stress response membrane protein [Thermoleophilaceae bacterium]
MGIIGWIVLGLLAGLIAKALLPGDDPGGLIITVIIGIVGALLGGFIAGNLLKIGDVDEFFDISTWLCAIGGSLILLLIYRAVAGGGDRNRTTV